MRDGRPNFYLKRVKFVLSSTLIYTMSANKLPTTWNRKLDNMVCKFFWVGSTTKDRLWCPMAWDKICRPKPKGGLGLLRFEDVNIALLCKIGWWMVAGPETLWSEALKAKYFSHSIFMKCKKKTNQLWQWKGLLSIRHILGKGICYRVGDGKSINFWEDPWIPNLQSLTLGPKHEVSRNQEGMVDSLLLTNGD